MPPPPTPVSRLDRLRTPALALALLVVSLYLPLAALVYLPAWYELNCAWHGRCARLGDELTRASIDHLTAFFAHAEPLAGRWSERERVHLSEVRVIYDWAGATALAALAVLALVAEPLRLRRAALINIAVVASLLLLLPVFGFFWRHVFHELLFANDLWQTTRSDLTWYLTPRTLFRNSLLALVAGGVGVNLLALLLASRWRRRSTRAGSGEAGPRG